MKCHPAFLRDAKSLRKKYAQIDEDIVAHYRLLQRNIPAAVGNEIPKQFGAQRVFKTRVEARNSSFGKSSGYRLIYLYVEASVERVLLHVYIHSKQGGGQGEQVMLKTVKDRLSSLDFDNLREFGVTDNDSDEPDA